MYFLLLLRIVYLIIALTLIMIIAIVIIQCLGVFVEAVDTDGQPEAQRKPQNKQKQQYRVDV